MIYTIPAAVILLVLALHFNVQDLFKSGWQFVKSKNMSGKPKVSGSIVSFNLSGRQEPHHVGTYSPDKPKDELLVRYRVSGKFEAVEGGEPTLSLFLQRKFDPWWGRWGFAGFRQYAEPIPLEDTGGEWRETRVPLKQSHWKNVGGKDRHTGLKWTLRLLNFMGVALGSRGGRAHGVRAIGNARIEIELVTR